MQNASSGDDGRIDAQASEQRTQRFCIAGLFPYHVGYYSKQTKGCKTDDQKRDIDHHFVDAVENIAQELVRLWRGYIDKKSKENGKENDGQHVAVCHSLENVVGNDGYDLVYKRILHGGHFRYFFMQRQGYVNTRLKIIDQKQAQNARQQGGNNVPSKRFPGNTTQIGRFAHAAHSHNQGAEDERYNHHLQTS